MRHIAGDDQRGTASPSKSSRSERSPICSHMIASGSTIQSSERALVVCDDGDRNVFGLQGPELATVNAALDEGGQLLAVVLGVALEELAHGHLTSGDHVELETDRQHGDHPLHPFFPAFL